MSIELKNNTIEKVEQFIKRIYNLEYRIDIKANGITYTNGTVLADCLANAMSNYNFYKNINPLNYKYAEECLRWIDKAFTTGVIKEGSGIIEKYEKCQVKCKQLENDIQKISHDYIMMQGMYKELDKRLNSMIPKKEFDSP